MNIPFTIAFSTTASTPNYFIVNAEKPVLLRNIFIHNEHTAGQIIHLTYKAGYSDTIGIGTVYDVWSQTIAAKTSITMNDLIVVNAGDSFGIYGQGNVVTGIANCVVL